MKGFSACTAADGTILGLRGLVGQKGRKQMGEIEEEILSGFCRQQNQGRTVTCEWEETEEGLRLSFVDCGYPKCVHKGSCLIAGEIRKRVSADPGHRTV